MVCGVVPTGLWRVALPALTSQSRPFMNIVLDAISSWVQKWKRGLIIPKVRVHEGVGEEFLHSASGRTVAHQTINAPADVLFESLSGAEDWLEWLGLDSVTYTSPEPRDSTTTRTVTMGRNILNEEFFAWEPVRRLGFQLESSTLPVRSFAEEYLISDQGDETCSLQWTVALEGRPRLLTPVLTNIMKRQAARTLPKLATLLEGRS